jgi:hypothetical protein
VLDSIIRQACIEPIEESAMPEQPADPIHYDMKIPPEPKQLPEKPEEAKKHGDKIDTGNSATEPSVKSGDDSPNRESCSA